ncbi:MAG: RecX family transcriptional regulator [Candidatus Azobacteroides sp.]|nr:RecX family transcriptional regulator [Candidatus Azobacteroides sp.]
MKIVSYEQALFRLAAYCSRGERCIFDVCQKMRQWEIAEEDQKKIVQRLQDEKFLDENRFCRAYVNDKWKCSHWGIRKIAAGLKRKQIPAALIREALSGIDAEENREQLYQLLAAKRKTVKGESEYEIRQKLIRFALGRGFAWNDIEAAMKLRPD